MFSQGVFSFATVSIAIIICIYLTIHVFLQLKVDEFESNVKEVKDPFPPADFPGNYHKHQNLFLA